MDGKQADLVLDGAGVKGISLVGVVATLAEAGHLRTCRAFEEAP